MFLWLAKLFARLAKHKVVPQDERMIYVGPDVIRVRDGALSLITQWDEVSGWSGEAKRHQVYARLLKRYPDMSRHEVAFALELAVRKVRALD